MSWATCYTCKSGSNNIHFDYPPLMSDGRNYTNWTPMAKLNEEHFKKSGIKSNFEYRQHLVRNAESIMKQNMLDTCDNCGVCYYGVPLQKESTKEGKYLYKSCKDATRPYGYESSDLKNMYLSRQALQSELYAPLMSQQGYLIERSQKR